MIDRDRAIAAIRASQFVQFEAELAELLEPSIRIGVRRSELDDLPLGVSRFGGWPDLPERIDWPRFGERPLALVAQLHLDDLAPYDVAHRLPERGWLYFFFDAANDTPFEEGPAGERSWQVLYFDGKLGELRRHEPPQPREKNNEFPPAALGLDVELTLPSIGSVLLTRVPIAAEEQDAYEDLVFSLHSRPPVPAETGRPWGRWLGRLAHRRIGDPIHRVLGHPEHFQVDPRIEWEQTARHRSVIDSPDPRTIEEARDWLLLLQLDTYRDGPGWLWGEHGTLYFGIRQQDLATGNFAAVQWTFECG